MENNDIPKEIVCSLFAEWANNVTPEDRDTETLDYFCKHTGAKAPSPLSMMFEAFRAGLLRGMELMKEIQDGQGQEEAFSLEEQERDEEAYFSAFGDDLLVVEDRGQGNEKQ